MSKAKFARRTGESRYPDLRIILYISYVPKKMEPVYIGSN